jgi:hypothetical protein
MEVSGQLNAPTALLPKKEPPVPTELEAGRAPEPVWTRLRRQHKCLFKMIMKEHLNRGDCDE